LDERCRRGLHDGVEFQCFSAFLEELNLLIDFSQVLADDASMKALSCR
jgi:hypothetical protein